MNKFLFILDLIPAIISVVKSVEKAVPADGQGAEKLSLVKEILEALYDGVTEVWTPLETVIGIIVKFFNRVGWFND